MKGYLEKLIKIINEETEMCEVTNKQLMEVIMKLKFSLCKYIIVFLFCVNICTGCSGNKTEVVKKNPETTDVPGKMTKFNSDGIFIINKSNSLSDGDVGKLSKEIKDLFYKNWGNSSKIENFTMKFYNEREEDGKLKADVRVKCNWTYTQKPEERPLIIGMKQELEKLKDKKLKKTGRKIIHGFNLEYSDFYMVTKKYNEDLEIHFNTNQVSDNYEILCYKYKDENGSELCQFDKYQESDEDMMAKGRKVFKQYLQDELQYKE
ncbi:MAG: hypothetical protein HFH68_12030 [Lachnospiraceae bacterium]|nr:hypothetical protein [Lachnospiraceae bacterium]